MSETVDMKVRTDRETRDRFSEIAKGLGMNASTAMNVFMRQFVSYGGFPFEVARREDYVPTRKEFTDEMERRWKRMQAGNCTPHGLIEA